MMNRLAWLLAAILVFALAFVSCGDNKDGDDDDDMGPEDVYTDPVTNLTWQNAHSDLYIPWQKANEYCENVAWAGFDDWRLPTIDELRTLVRGCPAAEPGGECGITANCRGQECWSQACYGCIDQYEQDMDICMWDESFVSSCTWHWSSTSRANDEDDIWGLSFNGALIFNDTVFNKNLTRCVRP